MRAKFLYLLILVSALIITIVSPASAAEFVLEEADLKTSNPYSNLIHVNLDNLNNLIVSDEYGLIWQVNPSSGGYTYYDTTIVNLTDAHRSSNKYYFTNGVNGIGYAEPSTGKSFFWNYDVDNIAIYKFGSLAIDGQGGIWVADYLGPEISPGSYIGGSLYKFQTAGSSSAPTADICPLRASQGDNYETWAYDLVFYDGFLWYYNWNDDLIYRLNPTLNAESQYELKSWATGMADNDFIEGRVLAFDASGLLWIPGGASGTIMSFDPVSQVLSTYTVPVSPTSVEGVTVLYGKVWYADYLGSAGVLDPIQAPHTHSDPLPSTTIYLPEAQCVSLGAFDQVYFYETKPGTLPFTERAITPTNPESGWTVIPLTPNDELNGINAAQSAVLITDTWRGDSVPSARLLRLKSEPGGNKVYLPAILR